MAAIKVSKLSLKFVEDRYPELLVAIDKIEKSVKSLPIEQRVETAKMHIAWLVVEAIRLSGGDPELIFEDEADVILDNLKHNYE